MNPLLRATYAAAGHLARIAVALAPPDAASKTLRAISARRGLLERYERWGRTARDARRPLVWLHAPSVGEGLQARPVADWLRAQQPDLQIAFTFFSPSAETFARSVAADFTDYLPFDAASDMDRALAALSPRALVFSKLDVWPMLSAAARQRGVSSGMISATVAGGSSRLGALPRALLHDAYASLARVGAVSVDDAARLVSLGVRPEAVTVTGDTRYDQAWTRAHTAGNAALVGALRSTRPTMVAGSTWPADERVLFEAWSAVRAQHAGARLLIAPHEPTAAHLEPIERWAATSGLRAARLDGAGAADADVVIIDRVGVLGDLYALATVAFVGGGFHDAGLHSVLEPAAFGVPVLFGPRHHNARDAQLLIDAGGARAVGSSQEAGAALTELMTKAHARDTAGTAARQLVSAGLGATERSGQLVLELLDL